MKRKQFILLITLAIFAGFIGGLLSSWLFTGRTAFTEKKRGPVKVIEAEAFRLVDKDGKIHALLNLEGPFDSANLSIWNYRYQSKLSIGGSGLAIYQKSEESITKIWEGAEICAGLWLEPNGDPARYASPVITFRNRDGSSYFELIKPYGSEAAAFLTDISGNRYLFSFSTLKLIQLSTE